MSERGAALVEALIVTATVGLIWASAVRALAELPAQSVRWETASAARQGVRVIETRVARLAAVTPIAIEVDGAVVRVPAVWPRRLGLFRPAQAGDVSVSEVTFLSRTDDHRVLILTEALPREGGSVAFSAPAGCGTAPACGIRASEIVLAIERSGACGLFRVTLAGARLTLAAIAESGADAFAPGSVVLPVRVDVVSFDRDERALRRYDGYRSDNILVDGLDEARFEMDADGPLGDGPFIGTGPLGWDVDQLCIRRLRLQITLTAAADAAFARTAAYGWRVRSWP